MSVCARRLISAQRPSRRLGSLREAARSISSARVWVAVDKRPKREVEKDTRRTEPRTPESTRLEAGSVNGRGPARRSASPREGGQSKKGELIRLERSSHHRDAAEPSFRLDV